jgi:hypothetical protein
LWAGFPGQLLNFDGMRISAMFFGLVTLLVTEVAKGSRAALLLLPWVLAIDLGVWGYSYIFSGGVRPISELTSLVAPPTTEAGTTVHERFRRPKLNVLLFHDLRVLRPLIAFAPVRTLSLSTVDGLRVSGANWVSDESGWIPVADPMPRARVVPEWRVARDPTALSGIDIRRTALVTKDLDAPGGQYGTATVVLDEPGRMLLDVATPRRALLVTTEAFDSGWKAYGRSEMTPLQTLAVYGDYLGLVLEPGEYRVFLSFEPASFKHGIYLSVSGLFLVVAVAGLAHFRSR